MYVQSDMALVGRVGTQAGTLRITKTHMRIDYFLQIIKINIGVTLAIFRDLGKTPVEKHSFIRVLSVGDSDRAPNFKTFEGILLGPTEFLKLDKTFMTSTGPVGDKKNEFLFLFCI